jgi:hypothetical protein
MSDEVVLVVYGWRDVEPGPLAWPFRDRQAAEGAIHAMPNASKWMILAGPGAFANIDAPVDVARVRKTGGVLLEQAG